MSDSDHLQAVLKERDNLESALSEAKNQTTMLETQHREKVTQLQAQAESLTQNQRMDQLSIRTLNDEVKQLQLKLSDVQESRDRDKEQYDEGMVSL
jgi:predicted  nucleic acid-binding Zn-ribbon protein